jgi:hypothetical protein
MGFFVELATSHAGDMVTSGVVLLSMQVWLSAERGDMVARKKGADDGKQRSNGK